MRVITQKTVGGPSVLEVAEADRPVAGPGEVLVKVGAAGVNPIDTYVRAGAFELLGKPPFTLGWDVAGTVEQLGDDVKEFEVGDSVYGAIGFPGAGNAR